MRGYGGARPWRAAPGLVPAPGPLILLSPSADTSPVTTFAAELVFWIILPALVAVGAAYLVWLLMQARIQVLSAHYQAALTKVETDCAQRRPALETLLAELRLERRRFLRRVPGTHGEETTLITQERLYLRNIPLTSWMQEELALGAGEELASQTLLPLVESAPSHSLTVSLPPP